MALTEARPRRASTFNAASEYPGIATVFATWAESADAALKAGSVAAVAMHAAHAIDAVLVEIVAHTFIASLGCGDR
jgi:hypothetical protein